MITLPKLLDSSGNETERLRPVALSISERIIPLSTASITLPEGQSIPDRSYIELFTPNGSAGIYRSRAPRTVYRQYAEYQLEHAVCEVGDWLVRAEIGKTQETLSDALAQVFGYYGGSRWQLGTVSAAGNVILSANYSNLLQTMNSLVAQVKGAAMEFDFSTTPWTINVTSLPETVTAEGRVSRNIESVSIQKDDSNLCTRVYLAGLSGGRMDADTIGTYGVIERRLTGEYTAQQAATVASAYLARYSEPSFSVSIDGVDFSSETGETLDRVAIGKLYRLVIPEENISIEKHIIAMNWRDVVNSPASVSITLSEPETTLIDFVRKQAAEASSYEEKQDVIESSIAEVEEDKNRIWDMLLQAGMSLDQQGQIVYDDEDGTVFSRLEEMTATIQSEVEASASQIFSSVQASVSVVYVSVLQETSIIKSQIYGSMSSLYTEIMQTASQIVIRTGDATKTFAQKTAPTGTSQNPLVQGDLWFKGEGQFRWGDTAGKYWLDDDSIEWGKLKSTEVYRYDGTNWVKVSDNEVLLQDTRFEQTREGIYQVAGEVRTVEGQVESYRAEFQTEADNIRSTVDEQVNGLHSEITQTAREINSSISESNSEIYSAIRQTATSIAMNVADQLDGVRSDLTVTANAIRSDVSASNSQLYSYIQQTATNIRIAVNNSVSGLYAAISVSADEIRSDVSASDSQIYSYIKQTATNISLSVRNSISGVYSSISVTAEEIRSDVSASDSKIYTYIKQTATSIRIAVNNSISGVYSSINATATEIRSDVSASASAIYSYIKQTATSISISVRNSISGVYSSINATATEIRSEVNASDSQIYSYVKQTATSISISVRNSISGVYSSISATATEIRSDVAASDSAIYSYIKQTATSISISVRNSISGVYSSISATAEEIRSDVSASDSAIYSYVKQTASQIRIDVRNTTSNIYSSIQANTDSISLKVGKGEVISSINQTAESITINAEKINLSGYVKATDITADFIAGKISQIASLTALAIQASTITTTGGIYASGFYIGSGSYESIQNMFLDGISLSRSGDTYTLKKSVNGQESTVGTFSRATSLSGAWASGVFTVTASPQGNEVLTSLTIPNGQITWSGNTATVPIYATIGTSATSHDTGKTATVDATDIFNNGYAQANSEYGKWNNGSTSTLYYFDTTSLSYKVAVGSGKRWYYKN